LEKNFILLEKNFILLCRDESCINHCQIIIQDELAILGVK